jgi:hypothetical protein
MDLHFLLFLIIPKLGYFIALNQDFKNVLFEILG